MAAEQEQRVRTRCALGARDVTGADIVRIGQTLAIEPWRFTDTAPAAADDPAGIVLNGGRRRVTLNLASSASGCVFLLSVASGGWCGLDDVAPRACQAFPADLHKLPCNDAEAPPGRDEWIEDQQHWHETVKRWNAMAASSGTPMDIKDFQRYLIEAQQAREVGAAWPEEVQA